jgi:hypothetical protein
MPEYAGIYRPNNRPKKLGTQARKSPPNPGRFRTVKQRPESLDALSRLIIPPHLDQTRGA